MKPIAMCQQRILRSPIYLILVSVVSTIICIRMYDFNAFSLEFIAEKQNSVTQISSNISSLLHIISPMSVPSADPTLRPFTPNLTVRPFTPNRPVQALILAYQRTGSSFFGDIFGQNPDAFYLYEPLDGAFVSMYGTSAGWAVPMEISHDVEGNLREPMKRAVILSKSDVCRDIPKEEQRVMSETLMGLYTCQFDAVATEIIGHKFMTQFSQYQPHLAEYRTCIGSQNSVNKCNFGACPARLGINQTLQVQCAEELSKHRPPRKQLDWLVELPLQLLSNSSKQNNTRNVANTSSVSKREPHLPQQYDDSAYKALARPQKNLNIISAQSNKTEQTHIKNDLFKKYIKCLHEVQARVDSCLKHIDTQCKRCRLHAVKTVRLDMESVEILLEHLPNLRVIHLLRDPRGVAVSRSGNDWSTGEIGKNDMVKAASMFCQVAAKDLKKRKELEKRFPGAFTQVIYEDFIENPVEVAKNIYKFIDMTLPDVIRNFLQGSTNSKRSARWQDSLSFHQSHDIHLACKELFNLVGDPRWLNI